MRGLCGSMVLYREASSFRGSSHGGWRPRLESFLFLECVTRGRQVSQDAASIPLLFPSIYLEERIFSVVVKYEN